MVGSDGRICVNEEEVCLAAKRDLEKTLAVPPGISFRQPGGQLVQGAIKTGRVPSSALGWNRGPLPVLPIIMVSKDDMPRNLGHQKGKVSVPKNRKWINVGEV